MKLARILVFFVLFLAASKVQHIVAQTNQESVPKVEYALPYPGLLPDHPLYFTKLIRDGIVLWMTRDPVKRSQVYLLISDKHLNMVKVLLSQNKQNLALLYLKKGENYFAKGVTTLEKYKINNSLPPGLLDKFELAGKKHKEEMEEIAKLTLSEEQQKTIEESLNIQEKAYQKVKQLNIPI